MDEFAGALILLLLSGIGYALRGVGQYGMLMSLKKKGFLLTLLEYVIVFAIVAVLVHMLTIKARQKWGDSGVINGRPSLDKTLPSLANELLHLLNPKGHIDLADQISSRVPPAIVYLPGSAGQEEGVVAYNPSCLRQWQ